MPQGCLQMLAAFTALSRTKLGAELSRSALLELANNIIALKIHLLYWLGLLTSCRGKEHVAKFYLYKYGSCSSAAYSSSRRYQ